MEYKVKKIVGKIEIATGLHIGDSSDSVEIGGVDSPVVRNPLTREPYIPGSSLKGKMRSLYELSEERIGCGGGVCDCTDPDCKVCKVFGSANTDKVLREKRKPTRLVVRDAFLTKESRAFFMKQEIVETKSENAINRITSKANPRKMERVLPGVSFDFEILFRIYDESDEQLLKDVLYKAMKLLESDYLGGGGSRGNGKIIFKEVSCDGISVEDFNK